ncbi:ferritin-like domain-containing protein [Nocardioides montaniterrae]
MSTSPAINALQDVLAAEHAATYVYSVLGAQTSQSAQASLYTQVTAAFLAHRDRRDTVTDRIRALGAEPVAASPAYAVPANLSTAAAIGAAALKLERSCAATYAFAVGSTTGADRAWATDALLDAAVREVRLGGHPEAFPGI